MTVTSLSNLPSWFKAERVAPVRGLLSKILRRQDVVGGFVFGSVSTGNADHLSDVDVVIVTGDDGAGAREAVTRYVQAATEVAYVGRSSKYPWFGELVAVHWRNSDLAAAEVGFVPRSELRSLYVPTTALVLKDVDGVIDRRRERCSARPAGPRTLSTQREYECFIGLVKIRKSLHRGHLWNCIEVLMHLRRLYIALLRDAAAAPASEGRPERDAETILGGEVCTTLAASLPSYSVSSIVAAATLLTQLILKHPFANGWDRESITTVMETINDEFNIVECA